MLSAREYIETVEDPILREVFLEALEEHERDDNPLWWFIKDQMEKLNRPIVLNQEKIKKLKFRET